MSQPQQATPSYWEHAGEIGYGNIMFKERVVEEHILKRLWSQMITISKELNVPHDGHVMDLGCGDGMFSNRMLAPRFRKVDGFDIAKVSIAQAQKNAASNTTFQAIDINKLNYGALPKYDAVFMFGILHHVKKDTPQLLKNLRQCASKVIVCEPNGGHIVRKLLEYTPSYKAAGEESFRTREMEKIFANTGFTKKYWARNNLFPNFIPKPIFQLLKPFEPIFENTPVLRATCTVNLWGFSAE